MDKSRRITLAIILLLTLPFLSEVKAKDLEFTLYWDFDYDSYAVGDQGVVSLSIENTGDVPFRVTWVGIHFEWEKEMYYFQMDLSDNPVYIYPQENVDLGSISFSVFENAVIGENSYYIKIYYEFYDGSEWVKDEWKTENYKIMIKEQIEVNWHLEGDTFKAGKAVSYSVIIRNNMKTTIKVLRVGVRAEWLPKGMYSFYEYDENPIIIDAGGLWESEILEMKIPKDVEEKWYACSLVIEYQYLKGKEWSEIKDYYSPDTYGFQVVKPESFIQRYKEVIGVVTGTVSAVTAILGMLKHFKKEKSNT